MILIKNPTRIDLAGGTLDIWPLSTLFAPGVCINAAINLYATVKAEKNSSIEGVMVNAIHFNKKILCQPGKPERSKTLFHRVLDLFPATGWELTVDCASPSGAGLGGSSALVIALIHAFSKMTNRKMSKDQMLELAKNIEARHLGIPTGVQDYVAALFGGTNRIDAGMGGISYSKFPIDKKEIEKRSLLFYSGQSRISGKANWLMFKKAIEGDKKMVSIFEGIAKNSLLVEKALADGNFTAVGKLMEKENSLREKLGPAVVPTSLKKLFSIIKKNGGHPKICGAGGGGCFMVWCEPEKKKAIQFALEDKGIRHLPFKLGTPSVRIK